MNTNTLALDSSDLSPTHTARGALAASGLILLAVGLPITREPLAYQASMGVTLPADPTLLSDMRAMGSGLLGFGGLLLASATRWPRLAPAAALAGAILYGTYGLGRVFSMAVDGLPVGTLIGSAAIELALGAVLAMVALRRPSR